MSSREAGLVALSIIGALIVGGCASPSKPAAAPAPAAAAAGTAVTVAAVPTVEVYAKWRAAFERNLRENILGFWLAHAPDRERGGFFGAADRKGTPDPLAPRSLVVNSRLVWTFAAAKRALGNEEYAASAKAAYAYLVANFRDAKYGGWFWSLSASGKVLDSHKHLYGQSFAIYGLAEYARTFGDKEALKLALDTFRLMDRKAHDAKNGGYLEPWTREWKPETKEHPIGPPDQKTTNTHLHLLESLTTLLVASGDAEVKARLEELYGLFLTKLVDTAGYAHEYFLPDWTPAGAAEASYGHDMELAWLMQEAAAALSAVPGPEANAEPAAPAVGAALGKPGDPAGVALSKALVAHSVKYGYDEARGGVFERGPAGQPASVRSKTWWAQAEALVGLLEGWKLTRDEGYWRRFEQSADFVLKTVCDNEYGEWYPQFKADGTVDYDQKISPWKCPYHNGRACMEIIRRLGEMMNAK